MLIHIRTCPAEDTDSGIDSDLSEGTLLKQMMETLEKNDPGLAVHGHAHLRKHTAYALERSLVGGGRQLKQYASKGTRAFLKIAN